MCPCCFFATLGTEKGTKAEGTEIKKRSWIFISPQFRGPNNKPDACASDIAIQDVLDAVEFAKQNANVDQKRIYILGGSGGSVCLRTGDGVL